MPVLAGSVPFGYWRLLSPFSPRIYPYLVQDLAAFAEENRMERMPLENAQKSFFDGLRSYLAARIAGVRWMQRRRRQGKRGEEAAAVELERVTRGEKGQRSGGFPMSGSAGGAGFLSSIKFWIDETLGASLALKTGVPCYQVEDAEGRIQLLLHLPVEEESEHRWCLWRPDQVEGNSRSRFYGALIRGLKRYFSQVLSYPWI
jgi:hypothetical protein